jgi:hypothetical protein
MKTIHSALLAGAALLLVPAAALAQEAPAAQPAVIETQAAAPMGGETLLPANSEVILSLNETVTSGTHRMGEKVFFTVAQDVKADGRTVIAQGTRAVGQITRRTGKGSFGKSGKMDVTFRYIDYNGQHIPVQGLHHQEGAGATAATIGAVVAAGVVGGLLVKGKSARIAQGREFTVRTRDAIPVTWSDHGSQAVIAASYAPGRVSMMAETEKQRKAREKAERARGKKAR